MGALKWITGFLGWVTGGAIGALIGYLLGSLAEKSMDIMQEQGGAQPGAGGSQGPWGGANSGGSQGPWGGANSGGSQGPWGNANHNANHNQNQRQGSYRSGGYSATGQRNSFMVSLLVLSSAVIKADGKTLQPELDYVKDFIRRNFGEQAIEDALKILDELASKQVNIFTVGAQIATNMNYSQRLQLFHYLTELANADGDFCKQEKSVLESIAAAIRLTDADAASVIAMFYKAPESAYAVLEISPDATDDEVKSAYRRMAMKFHPDKVATLGPDVQKAAEEKFRKIQSAYETIKKQRGIN